MVTIPRLAPPFQWSDLRALATGWWLHEGTRAFEQAMRVATGARFALAYPYGRSAFFSLMQVMGWQDREIVLPAFTCAVMANAVLGSGNRPRFLDISLRDFNMDLGQLRPLLNSATAAVVPTHMYGFPADLKALAGQMAGREDVFLLQDCALAHGTTFGGQPVWRQGGAAIFSFSVGKQISSVEGGVLVTDDPALQQALSQHRQRHFQPASLAMGVKQSLFFLAAWLGFTPAVYPLVHWLAQKTSLLEGMTTFYAQDRVMLPANLLEELPSCLGYLGAGQVARLGAILQRKQAISRRYRQVLEGLPGLTLPDPLPGATFSHFPCLVDDRQGFLKFMLSRGIQVGTEVFDYVVPHIPVFRPYAEGDYPVAQRVVASLALLPNQARLSDQDVERVVRALEQWRRRRVPRRP